MEVHKWNLTDVDAVGKILYKSQNLRNGASIILYALKPNFLYIKKYGRNDKWSQEI